MALGKRIFLFLITNLLIVVSISLVVNLLGIEPYLSQQGIDYPSLILFCLLWGFGGAFISLAISRPLAKWMMGVKVIKGEGATSEEQWLVRTVARLSQQAALPKTPEIGIYESEELNAFATGATQNRALVAVSSGLLRRMNESEREGVLAHEIAHIANGDMVTMTLVQGVINAFVMFFARVIAWSLSQFVDEDKRGLVHMVAVILFEIAFSLLGMFVVAAYSRRREYRADLGSAALVGSGKMIAALRALKHSVESTSDQSRFANTFKINGERKSGGLLALLSSHPPLDDRIEKLMRAR